MYIFDVSRQGENLKRAAVDATLFMTFAAAAPAMGAGALTAYSIIYFDSRYEVSSTQIRPLTQICKLSKHQMTKLAHAHKHNSDVSLQLSKSKISQNGIPLELTAA